MSEEVLRCLLTYNVMLLCRCHDAGASSLLHASQHQLLISAGKKGQICIWDIRQAKLLNTFKAHDHAVKCLAMDANETILCTGSVDGDLKVWDLTWHKAVHSFPGEHSRHGLFKNISQGVAQVRIRTFLLNTFLGRINHPIKIFIQVIFM